MNRSAFLSIVLFSSLAFAQSAKLSPELERASPDALVDVIVQYKQVPTSAQFEKVHRAHGAELRHALPLIRAGAFSKIRVSELPKLAADPEIGRISADTVVWGTLDNATGAIGAAAAWSKGLSGSGIGVAIVDSGLAAEYSYAVKYAESFIAGDTSVADAYGHGTHVMGILSIPSAALGSRTLSGVAPSVSLINLRVLDKSGNGTDSAVIAAIQRAVALKGVYNIRVINLSLGRPVTQSYKTDPLCQAVEAAWKAGIVVVVAAGNNGRDNSHSEQGYGTITAPGNDPYVITVGAMKSMNTPSRTDDLIASYSSKGPTSIDHIVKPDLVAPGNQVI